MPTLLELQRSFLGALLGDPATVLPLIAGPGPVAADLVGVYANNAASNFLESLRLTYPAVLRLTGDDYFNQAVHAYRRDHPSRSGDLQGAGAAFPSYLAARHAGDVYRYLGDVARFEWLLQESLLAADHAPFDLQRLAAVAPEAYDELRFELHPAARLFESAYPAYTIWDANVGSDAEPATIDLDQGGERVLIGRSLGRSVFHPLSAAEHAFLEACAQRQRFDAAIAAAGAADPNFDAGAVLQRFVLAGSIVAFSL